MVDVLLSDPQKLAELIPVNLQAIEDWQRVASELRCDLEIVMQGGLMLAETEAEHELLLRKNALEVQAGLAVRIVDRAELRRLAPYLSEQVRFASFCPQEGHANPRLIAPAFAASATGVPIGTRDMLSTPAAITTSCVPDMTAWAAKWIACCEEPHWRSIVTAGTLSGSFDANTALRPM